MSTNVPKDNLSFILWRTHDQQTTSWNETIPRNERIPKQTNQCLRTKRNFSFPNSDCTFSKIFQNKACLHQRNVNKHWRPKQTIKKM